MYTYIYIYTHIPIYICIHMLHRFSEVIKLQGMAKSYQEMHKLLQLEMATASMITFCWWLCWDSWGAWLWAWRC